MFENIEDISDDTLSSILAELKISKLDYEQILIKLGRYPSYTELGLFSAMWSEHCSYRTTKEYISKLPKSSKQVYKMSFENAGGVYLNKDYLAIFKIESHNHPSFIEPHQGAATGIGGILRDIFAMNAKPIAVMNFLKFGALDNIETKRLVTGVSAGIGSYANSFGVATLAGDCEFYDDYNKNILVNCFALGIVAKKDLLFSKVDHRTKSKNQEKNNFLVYYLGAKTGRDGLHGASMASDSFTQTKASKTVIQVADPFLGSQLKDATLKLTAKNLIEAAQDMGAAGLTSSTVEMADKGGFNIEIDCDAIPLRNKNLEPFEIMLSESQERMLFLIKEENLSKIKSIIDQNFQLNHAVIGKTSQAKNKTNYLSIKKNDQIFAHLPIRHLIDYPKNHQSLNRDLITKNSSSHYNNSVDNQSVRNRSEDVVLTNQEILKKIKATKILDLLLEMTSNPNLGSKRRIFSQYDQYIQNRSLVTNNAFNNDICHSNTSHESGCALASQNKVAAGFDYSLLEVGEADCQLALAYTSYPRYAKLSPLFCANFCITNLYRKLIIANSLPLAYTNNLNFANPKYAKVMKAFIDTIDGMCLASKALDFPTVSGNVSLYNQTDDKAIVPTLVTVGVGKLNSKYKLNQLDLKVLDQIDKKISIIAIGDLSSNCDHLGLLGSRLFESYNYNSVFDHNKQDRDISKYTPINHRFEIKLAGFIQSLFAKNLILQQSLTASGGILFQLLRLALNYNCGFKLFDNYETTNLLAYYFCETRPLYLVCSSFDDQILDQANKAGVFAKTIGCLSADSVIEVYNRNGLLEKQDLAIYRDRYNQNLADIFS